MENGSRRSVNGSTKLHGASYKTHRIPQIIISHTSDGSDSSENEEDDCSRKSGKHFGLVFDRNEKGDVEPTKAPKDGNRAARCSCAVCEPLTQSGNIEAISIAIGGTLLIKKQKGGIKARVTYSREFFLHCADSLYSRLPPEALGYILRTTPDILRQIPGMLKPKDYESQCNNLQ